MIYKDFSLSNDGIITTYQFGLMKHYLLLQYTGLKDKNGKEIYEGDIVKTSSGLIGEVKYQYDCFSIYIDNGFGYFFGHKLFKLPTGDEVIGNIYHNPELLK